jgi:hypothetical protein
MEWNLNGVFRNVWERALVHGTAEAANEIKTSASRRTGLVEESDACFIVRDHDGQKLAYIYFEEEPGRRSAAKLLTRDEARRIVANIAKLPQLRKAD